MKKLLTVLFLLWSTVSLCINSTYYVSSSGGNDLNTSAQAQSPTTPWRTISKLNSFGASFAAGDHIMFKRGDLFTGTLTFVKSGTVLNPIVVDAYGSGVNPILSGFSVASGWVSTGTNIWTSTSLGNTNVPKMVTIGGTVKAIGRWPNGPTWRTYTTHTDNSITDLNLGTQAPINLTGADACIAKLHDQRRYFFISNHTGNTITFTNTDGYKPINGYGYFIENALFTLDQPGEWFWDKSTKKVNVYSVGAPVNVMVATTDTLINIKANDYITIQNIDFDGANVAAITFGGPSYGQSVGININGCNVTNSGQNAIYATWDDQAVITNNTINNTLNNAIMFENEGSVSSNATISYNTIKNTGMIVGMWENNGNAITVTGDGHTINNNFIDSTGHIGIAFYNNNIYIHHNWINYYCAVGGDAGGINTFDLSMGSLPQFNRRVYRNFVMNGAYGEHFGTPDAQDVVMSFYADDKSWNIDVKGNTFANTPYAGIYGHNVFKMNFDSNTVYGAGLSSMQFTHDTHMIDTAIRNIHSVSNTFYDTLNKFLVTLNVRDTYVDSVFNKSDSNEYFKPVAAASNTFSTQKLYGISTNPVNKVQYTATSWNAAFTRHDQHSRGLAQSNAKSHIFINPSDTVKTVVFTDSSYKDVRTGAIYNNSLTIQPWENKIVQYNGVVPPDNTPPVVNAGGDKTITLPVDYVTVTGTATQTPGFISFVEWTGADGVISTPNFNTTLISSLAEGDHVFTFSATNTVDIESSSTMTIHVLPAPPTPTIPAGKVKCNCIFKNVN